jgi:hypothetical protein
MWNRKAAIEWTIDQIENKLSGIYNTIDALFYLQGQSFVNQCDEIIDVPVFSNEPLTERQQKLFINELAKHIDGITWEEYQAYKAEKEAEAQAIIEAHKQSEQNIMNETQENAMTTTKEDHQVVNSTNNKEHGYLQFFAAATAYDYDQIINSLIDEFLPNEREMFYILCKYLHKSQRQQVTQQTAIQFTCQVMQNKLNKSNNKYKNNFSFDLETSEAHEARKEAWKRLKTLERKGLITITNQETTFKDYIAKSKKASFNVTRKLITLTPYGKQVAKQLFNTII